MHHLTPWLDESLAHQLTLLRTCMHSFTHTMEKSMNDIATHNYLKIQSIAETVTRQNIRKVHAIQLTITLQWCGVCKARPPSLLVSSVIISYLAWSIYSSHLRQGQGWEILMVTWRHSSMTLCLAFEYCLQILSTPVLNTVLCSHWILKDNGNTSSALKFIHVLHVTY